MPEIVLTDRQFNRMLSAAIRAELVVDPYDKAVWAAAKTAVPRNVVTEEDATVRLRRSKAVKAAAETARANGHGLVPYVRKSDGVAIMAPQWKVDRWTGSTPKAAPQPTPKKASKKATPAPVQQAPDMHQALLETLSSLNAATQVLMRMAEAYAQE